MKEQQNIKKTNFFKKIFIKICRLLNYEIIDQSTYEVPTLGKNLNDTLSYPGKKSITVPLGKFEIKRKIKSLKIIFRSSTRELILDQNKKRLFNHKKNEYTFRSLNSLLKSIQKAREVFKNINFEIIVTDTRSEQNDIKQIKEILSKSNIPNKLIEINLDDLKEKIIGNYTEGKFANMANLYTSLALTKENSNDLIYFVEDDYIHTKNCILEMLFSYEKLSTLLSTEIFLLPADYPYLYTKSNPTRIILGHQKHWRQVDKSQVTFMTSRDVVLNNFEKFMQMATKWEDPWEKP